jgi:hypothetical protein
MATYIRLHNKTYRAVIRRKGVDATACHCCGRVDGCHSSAERRVR